MSGFNPSSDNIKPWHSPSFEDGSGGVHPLAATDAPAESAGEAARPSEFVPVIADADPFVGEGFQDDPVGAKASVEGADGEPDFAAMKFLRENTLLSNAEKYAASIQEEAELYVTRLREEAETLNQEAEARYEEALLVKEQAKKEADALVASAQEETDRIRDEARLEGFTAGKEAGTRQGYKEAAPHLQHLDGILQELGNYRRQVAYYAEKDSIRLAVLMAKQVLRQELKVNRKAVWNLLAKTLSTLEGQGQFRIWLSPEDYEFAKTARASLERYVDEHQSITFRARPNIPPGNVQIETDREVIDLTFQNQFHYLERVINQTLAERETLVTQRPASAEPPIPEENQLATSSRRSTPATTEPKHGRTD